LEAKKHDVVYTNLTGEREEQKQRMIFLKNRIKTYPKRGSAKRIHCLRSHGCGWQYLNPFQYTRPGRKKAACGNESLKKQTD